MRIRENTFANDRIVIVRLQLEKSDLNVTGTYVSGGKGDEPETFCE